MTDTVPAANTGLPIAIQLTDPMPGLATRPRLHLSIYDAAEHAAAMNAVQVALNAILAEGGANA